VVSKQDRAAKHDGEPHRKRDLRREGLEPRGPMVALVDEPQVKDTRKRQKIAPSLDPSFLIVRTAP
jgi:hypothetical protein